jgi:hypothetical protein
MLLESGQNVKIYTFVSCAQAVRSSLLDADSPCGLSDRPPKLSRLWRQIAPAGLSDHPCKRSKM